MELKRLITNFTYRIEPKPEGGFVAHASDPTVPPLEAPTREELQEKIQAKIFAALETEFPGLKIPAGKECNFAFHIEHKAGGGFAIRSADPNAPTIEGATHEEIANPFAEKLLTFVGRHLMPELAEALAAQGGSADVKVTTTTRTFALGRDTSSLAAQLGKTLIPSGTFEPVIVEKPDSVPADTGTISTDQSGQSELAGNSPITPESSGIWNMLRLLLALVIMAAMVYFFMHRP